MSAIQEFYNNSNILITGGTGFLGKLLVEKLLRCCPNVNHIYLIMRNKNGLCPKQRMEKYFEDQVFTRLKLENPNYKSKVTVIPGDLDLYNLNLINDDRELLINSINIVFHAAASISFNQSLRDAVKTNLHGIRKILKLCKQIKNLKALIHISTVYSNCHLKRVEEQIYNTSISYEDVINLLNKYSDDEIKQMTPKLLGNSPNTYTFTKALAEKYVADHFGELPVGIFRPAIVVSTAKEPISGWIDNFYGPTGLISSAACGFLHVMHAGYDLPSNIVPADMVVNCIIASGWEIGLKNKTLPIYNYVSTQNPVSWGEYVELIKLGLDYPFTNSIWYISIFFTRSKWFYDLMKFILHIIPAFILDCILRFVNKKPQFLKKYDRIHNFVNVLSYFTNREWEFTNKNVLSLWSKMNEIDKKKFYFDMSALNWNEYFKHYIKGIRVFLFKDELNNVEKARLKYQRLYWLHKISKFSSLLFVFYYFSKLLY